MDTSIIQYDGEETIAFFDVDIDRKDETFSKEHIDFFMKHLRTDKLVFFTSEDVKYLNNFEFLRIMCKKCTKPATHRVCIRPVKTLDIRPPIAVMIRPLLLKERDFIFA